MRNRLWLLVAACALVAVGIGVAAAATGPRQAASSSTEYRYTHMYTTGPSASCNGDSCGVGTVAPILIHLPAATHRYSGTITVSFGYLTTGDGLFRANAHIRTPTFRTVGEVLPSSGRTVGLAADRTSMTLVFQALSIPAGEDLRLDVGMGVTEEHDAHTSISTANMLVQARFSSG